MPKKTLTELRENRLKSGIKLRRTFSRFVESKLKSKNWTERWNWNSLGRIFYSVGIENLYGIKCWTKLLKLWKQKNGTETKNLNSEKKQRNANTVYN